MLIKNSFGVSNRAIKLLRKGLPSTEFLQPGPQNEARGELSQPQMEPIWSKSQPGAEGR